MASKMSKSVRASGLVIAGPSTYTSLSDNFTEIAPVPSHSIASVAPIRTGIPRALLLPEGLLHQQPDNDHDALQDEQLYKRIVIRHCKIISLRTLSTPPESGPVPPQHLPSLPSRAQLAPHHRSARHRA